MCFDKHSDRQVLSPSVFDTRTLSNECRGVCLCLAILFIVAFTYMLVPSIIDVQPAAVTL